MRTYYLGYSVSSTESHKVRVKPHSLLLLLLLPIRNLLFSTVVLNEAFFFCHIFDFI